MENFQSFHGVVTMIDDFWITANEKDLGCYKLFTLEDSHGGIVNFVVSPKTYFLDNAMVQIGDMVTGFYDANLPVPMIFPPQYGAIVMAITSPYQAVKVDYFNNQLVSSDNTLKLNLAPYTQILLENGQRFTRNLGNRNLIVSYGPTTRSIPAQTTPYKVVVMCTLL